MKKKFILLSSDNTGLDIGIRIITSQRSAFAAMKISFDEAAEAGADIVEKRLSFSTAFIRTKNREMRFWRIVEADIADMTTVLLCSESGSQTVTVSLYSDRKKAESAMRNAYQAACESNIHDNASINTEASMIQLMTGNVLCWNIKALPEIEWSRDIVEQYYRKHPEAKQIECIRATGISSSLVCTYWPAETGWGSSFDKVEAYFRANPGSSQRDCARATGLSPGTVSKYWSMTETYKRMRVDVEEYYRQNPNASYTDCETATGYRAYYIKRFWPGTIRRSKHISIKKTSVVNMSVAGVIETYRPYKNKTKEWDLRSGSNVYGLSCVTLKELKDALLADYYDGLIDEITVS